MRFVADEEAASHIKAHPRELVHFREQRARIHHHAVADEADNAGMQDAGRNEMEDELAASDVDGVAGVVSALIARHHIEVGCQQVDNLALALIAPLGAKYTQIHAGKMIPSIALMVLLDGLSLTLDDLQRIATDGVPVGLAGAEIARVNAARAVVDAAAARPEPVYGINTGFGALAEVGVPSDQLAALQVNLLRSHAAGVEAPLSVPEVRAVMTLRANVLARGCSGIRLATLEALIALLNHGIHPRVPSRGSV